MRIAILGATSQIAQDLILSFSKCKDYDFSIFGRNVALLQKWINSESLVINIKFKSILNLPIIKNMM